MARKSFSFIKDVNKHFNNVANSSNTDSASDLNWKICFICQSADKEKLICPANSTHATNLKESYKQLLDDIRRFKAFTLIEKSLTEKLTKIDIEEKCVENKAVFHKRCRSKYDNLHYERATKRKKVEDVSNEAKSDSIPLNSSPCKTRSKFVASNFKKCCFFCNNDANEVLSQVQTLVLDTKIREQIW